MWKKLNNCSGHFKVRLEYDDCHHKILIILCKLESSKKIQNNNAEKFGLPYLSKRTYLFIIDEIQIFIHTHEENYPQFSE